MPFAASVELDQPRLRKVRVLCDGSPTTFRDTLDHWQNDGAFRTWFSQLILDAPFRAVRWETPPVTRSTIDRDFEFVLHDAPGLLCRQDSRSFGEHFNSPAQADGVVSFENLGRDAMLVVPIPLGADYGHLAAFLRHAPEAQRHALWRRIGLEMTRRLSDRPLWLSTAGMGVPWLHIRLDSRPKYYGHRPYAMEGSDG